MDKKKIEFIATILLIAVFIVVLSRSLLSMRRKYAELAPLPKAKAAFQQAQGFDNLNNKFNAMNWARDPFGLIVIEAGNTSYCDSLRGIIWDPESSQAIFGNRFLKTGDKIKGYKILEIKRERVTLTDGILLYELRVGQSLSDLK